MSNTSKMYDFALNNPVTAWELGNSCDVSRSTIYITFKELGVERVRLTRRSKFKVIPRIEAWKLVKAGWFPRYLEKVREQDAVLNACGTENDEGWFEGKLLSNNYIDEERLVAKQWPKLYRLQDEQLLPLSYEELELAAYCKLIPTIKYKGETYVERKYYDELKILRDTGVKIKYH